MVRRRENRAALAAVAAASGVGFSSGREVVLFFSQTGWASWIGVCFAAAMFGVLCAVVCRFAAQTGERSFSGVYMRVLDIRQGTVVGVFHGLLTAMTAGVMLSAAGELAMLSLPFRNAFWMGVLIALIAALLLNMRGMRALPGLGLLAAALCVCFHICLALDPRPAPIVQRYETRAQLSGSMTAALLLSMLHAALNASVAGGIVVRFAGREVVPARFGAKCGGLMLVLLAAANGAILTGGERLLSQALPTVVLAARWGIGGYYASIAVMGLCAIATLAAMLGTLAGETMGGSGPRRAALIAMALAGLSAFFMGMEGVVELGYPLVGWACAFSLAALACHWERGPEHDEITC